MAEDAPDLIQQAFDRGVVARTLQEYGEHLKTINGSVEKTATVLNVQAEALHGLANSVQSLVQRLDAEAATRLAMAAALKDADDVRRSTDEQARLGADRKWSVPLTRLSIALGILGSAAALYFAFRPH